MKKESQEPTAEPIEPSKEDWNAFAVKARALRKEVLQKILTNDAAWKRYEDEGKELFRNIDSAGFDTQRYLMYHLHHAGGTSYDRSPKTDFPGEYSIIEFYQRTLEQSS